MSRPLLPVLCAVVFGAIGWWWIYQRGDVDKTAAIVGHWESPPGGIHFDAVESGVFQLDIMHTFFCGKWERTDAGSWRLRFYDLSADEPLMNDSTGVGKVTLNGQGGDRKLDLVMPDGGKLTFKHEGPPSPVDLDF